MEEGNYTGNKQCCVLSAVVLILATDQIELPFEAEAKEFLALLCPGNSLQAVEWCVCVLQISNKGWMILSQKCCSGSCNEQWVALRYYPMLYDIRWGVLD